MQEEKNPAVYILTNKRHGTLYTGVTSALWNRVADHKNKVFDGFSKKYGATMLVWYEHHHFMDAAIKREKQIKKWYRLWKIRTIEKLNPDWRDLHDEIDCIATLVELKFQ